VHAIGHLCIRFMYRERVSFPSPIHMNLCIWFMYRKFLFDSLSFSLSRARALSERAHVRVRGRKRESERERAREREREERDPRTHTHSLDQTTRRKHRHTSSQQKTLHKCTVQSAEHTNLPSARQTQGNTCKKLNYKTLASTATL